MLRYLIVAVFSWCAFGSAAHAQDSLADSCFDSVVVAEPIKQEPRPIPDLGPNQIVMSWPWDVKIDVKASLVGDHLHGRRTVTMILHTQFVPIKYMLLYLKRQEDHSYLVVDTYADVVLDQLGRLVIP